MYEKEHAQSEQSLILQNATNSEALESSVTTAGWMDKQTNTYIHNN